jgi:hypothetical protein
MYKAIIRVLPSFFLLVMLVFTTSAQTEVDCEQIDLTYGDISNDQLYNLLSIDSSPELLSVASIVLSNGQINEDGCLRFDIEIISTNYTTYAIRVDSVFGNITGATQAWIDITNGDTPSTLTAQQTKVNTVILYPDSHFGIRLSKWGFSEGWDWWDLNNKFQMIQQTYYLRFIDFAQSLRLAFNQGLLSEETDLDLLGASDTIMSHIASTSNSPEFLAMSNTISAFRAGTENDPGVLTRTVFNWTQILLQNPEANAFFSKL